LAGQEVRIATAENFLFSFVRVDYNIQRWRIIIVSTYPFSSLPSLTQLPPFKTPSLFIHIAGALLAFVRHMYNVVVVRNGTVFFILFERSSREFQGVFEKDDGARWWMVAEMPCTHENYFQLPPFLLSFSSSQHSIYARMTVRCVLQNNQKPSIPKIYVAATYISITTDGWTTTKSTTTSTGQQKYGKGRISSLLIDV
jgi:hypothetical protein